MDEPSPQVTLNPAKEGSAGSAGRAEEGSKVTEDSEPDAQTDIVDLEAEHAPEGPAADASESLGSLGTIETFKDRTGEWRWRLVHRNGNVIATSGEGYTRRRNAEKGLRSVVENAPGANVVDDLK